LCGDGTLQTVQVDEQGNVAAKTHSQKFFDPDKDPLTEKASRYGDTWLFFSFDGYVHPVTFTDGKAIPGKRWSLFNAEDAKITGRSASVQCGNQDCTSSHQADRTVTDAASTCGYMTKTQRGIGHPAGGAGIQHRRRRTPSRCHYG
jgi:hypothetical protein